jgi:flavin-dependent dehydrogenase
VAIHPRAQHGAFWLFHVNPLKKHTYDVAVVGSGPAGSAAALYLAKQGVRVGILEKNSLPRYKTCGGGVVRKAIGFLPFDLSGVIERDCYTSIN